MGASATPALAAPAETPVLAAAPADDDATDPDRPLRIEVSRFDPRTVTPGSPISVTGVLTNTGSSTITDVDVRLQRGDVLRSREELAALDDDPDPATAVVLPFMRLEDSIEPGGQRDFTYLVPDSAELLLDQDGVYPVLLNVNGTVDGDTRRVGELSTFVVQQPIQPVASTAVAWLWPLTERSHRTASGNFADDGLADSISAGGRLDRALSVVERLPGNVVPALRVTLAIDPALVEELQLMKESGGELPGDAAAAAKAAEDFLGRLSTVADAHAVVALPYGDVDVDALEVAGLGDVVTRSLPGTPDGTAQDPLGPPADASSGATLPPAGESDAPADDAAPPEDGAGARIINEVLDVAPSTDLAWAPGGTLHAGTIERLRGGGVDRVVLSSEGLSTGDEAIGLRGNRAAAATTVAAWPEDMDVLVADPRLTGVVGRSESTEGGPRLAEQRFLAELAVLTAQAEAGSVQTVLVSAPRDVDAGPDGAGAMMTATTSYPWLRPVAVGDLPSGPVTDGGDLIEPFGAPALDPAGLSAAAQVVAGRNDLAGAVEGDPGIALEAFDAALARSTSVAWRTDPDGFRGAVADVSATLQRMRGQVTLLAPADGTYTLASDDAPLVLTVRNDLPFAVRVLLDVRARANRGLTVGDIGVQVLAPGQRATLQVPTTLRQSGRFAVTATLTTPAGTDLGERVQMQVRSGAYGPITLIITIGAAALLALLFLRRLVNFLLRRRARAAGGQPVAGPDSSSGTPTRSPV